MENNFGGGNALQSVMELCFVLEGLKFHENGEVCGPVSMTIVWRSGPKFCLKHMCIFLSLSVWDIRNYAYLEGWSKISWLRGPSCLKICLRSSIHENVRLLGPKSCLKSSLAYCFRIKIIWIIVHVFFSLDIGLKIRNFLHLMEFWLIRHGHHKRPPGFGPVFNCIFPC